MSIVMYQHQELMQKPRRSPALQSSRENWWAVGVLDPGHWWEVQGLDGLLTVSQESCAGSGMRSTSAMLL